MDSRVDRADGPPVRAGLHPRMDHRPRFQHPMGRVHPIRRTYRSDPRRADRLESRIRTASLALGRRPNPSRCHAKPTTWLPILSHKLSGWNQSTGPRSGQILFDSIDAGIDTLEETHFLFELNAMIAVGDSRIGRQRTLVYIDLDTAQPKWTVEADAGRILDIESIPGNKALVVSLFEVRCFDANTGAIVWTKPTTLESGQLKGALGGFLKTLAETAVQNMEIEVDYYLEGDTFYIGSGNDEEATSTYIAYDASSGSMRWQSDLRAYAGDLLFAPQGIVTLSRVSNHPTRMIGAYRVNLLDPANGQGQWGKRGNGIALKGGATNYFELGDRLIVCTDAGKNALVYLIDLNTGTLVHDKPAKFNGDLQGLYASASGIICLGSEETNLYDPNKGEFVWNKSIRTTPEDKTPHYTFDAFENRLYLERGDQGLASYRL
ncbi:MAG: hypothetical protein CBD18_03910 [Opitutales bacterium TMED158]|nr:MAG: hypothetical protein CBD18_03910 [Opitutales bacterium TMED158]